jgi:hypothetical protein
VVEALGVWGIRWIGEIGDEDLDPKLLLWDMHRNVDYAAVPPGRTVVQFRFPDVPSATRDWWLVIGSAETDVCDDDPGHPVAVTVTGSLRRLTEVWRGDMSWPDALRAGAWPSRARPRCGGPCRAGSPCQTSPRSPGRLNSRAGGHGVGDPTDGDVPRVGGGVVGDPAGVGELLPGVAEGLAVCDGLDDRAAEGEVRVGARVDEVGDELPADWVVSACVVVVPGLTRK